MRLLVDVGNSRLKWAAEEGGVLQRGAPLVHAGGDLVRLLNRAWGDLPRPRRVLVSSVAPAARNRALQRWISRRWQREAQFLVAARRAAGVVNAYPEPWRLGPDRWAALIAARAAGLAPAWVVDCGTAVTVDLLEADGRHRGGLIVPGLRLARTTLTERTGQIGRSADPDRPGAVTRLAQNTHDAVHGGALYQLVAFLDRAWSDLREEMGPGLRGVITGGDAETLHPLLRAPLEWRPDLVLEGLAALAERGYRFPASGRART